MSIFAGPIPLEETVLCSECGKNLFDEAYYDGEFSYCETCMDKLLAVTEQEAKAYAEQNCKITSPLPRYDSTKEYRCTPEEYEDGMKESYTPNSHMCHCRHNCTNYEELIKPLDEFSVRDRIYYAAIRERVFDLLEEAIEDMELEFDEEDIEAEFDEEDIEDIEDVEDTTL